MMDTLFEKIESRIQDVAGVYHRLVLVVGASGVGKTRLLAKAAEHQGYLLVNVNLELSRRLLDLTERQRALQVGRLLEEALPDDQPVVMLDNTEILFDVSLQQDPLRLLQGLSRNRTIVASWNGTLDNGRLLYATPDHPEHRRYPARDLVMIHLEAAA